MPVCQVGKLLMVALAAQAVLPPSISQLALKPEFLAAVPFPSCPKTHSLNPVIVDHPTPAVSRLTSSQSNQASPRFHLRRLVVDCRGEVFVQSLDLPSPSNLLSCLPPIYLLPQRPFLSPSTLTASTSLHFPHFHFPLPSPPTIVLLMS